MRDVRCWEQSSCACALLLQSRTTAGGNLPPCLHLCPRVSWFDVGEGSTPTSNPCGVAPFGLEVRDRSLLNNAVAETVDGHRCVDRDIEAVPLRGCVRVPRVVTVGGVCKRQHVTVSPRGSTKQISEFSHLHFISGKPRFKGVANKTCFRHCKVNTVNTKCYTSNNSTSPPCPEFHPRL